MSDEEPTEPIIPPDAPSFTEDDRGTLTLVWPDPELQTVPITREALQALVDRANQGRPKLT